MDELSAAEKEAYKSAAFTFETLPINAPAKEFCFWILWLNILYTAKILYCDAFI